MTKTSTGNFFEDFRLGQTIRHATPRTVTVGDVALYNGLFGAALRGAVVGRVRAGDRLSARAGRRPAGLPHRVRQDRAGRLAQRRRQSRLRRLPLPARRSIPGDTLTAVSEVIGLKENSSRKTGIVYVRSTGFKQDGSRCWNMCAG